MTNPFYPYPMPRLTCELVPSPLWYNNLRKMLTKSRWDAVRAACYKKAGMTCECCGDLRGRPPEAHEIWSYDDQARVQRLDGVVSLCYLCHRVKHIGFALTQGQLQFLVARNHLRDVNQWPEELALQYVKRQFDIHALRSRLTWTQDLTWLDSVNAYIASAEEEQREAQGKLAQRTLDAMRSRDADK